MVESDAVSKYPVEASGEGEDYDRNMEVVDADDDEDADEDDEEGDNKKQNQKAGVDGHQSEQCSKDNRCDLLWSGILAKRSFQGFKFQECATASTARKVLEGKGFAGYWDMAFEADNILEASRIA
jgi:U4/U6 small nuclear ribonucleoprotein PRP3